MRAYIDCICMSIKNIMRGRLRTVLSVVAIAIGIAAVFLLNSIGSSAKKLINAKLESIGISGIMVFTGDYSGLSMADGERIKSRVSEVESFMPFDSCIGYYTLHGTKTVPAIYFGVNERLSEFMGINVIHGRLFTSGDMRVGSNVCIVGSDFALSEYGRTNVVGKTLNVIIDNASVEYKIIGVVSCTLNDLTGVIGFKIPTFIYLPYLSLSDGDLAQLAVKLYDGSDAEDVSDKISSVLSRSNPNGKHFQVENISGYRSEFDSVLDVITLLLSATAAISLFVAGIGVMNTMLAGVNDRRAEIGICKAVGATRGQIARLFLTEALILSAFGGACGILLGFAIIIPSFLAFGLGISVTLSGILVPCAVTMLIGLLSGLMPAVMAASLQPVTAMFF